MVTLFGSLGGTLLAVCFAALVICLKTIAAVRGIRIELQTMNRSQASYDLDRDDDGTTAADSTTMSGPRRKLFANRSPTGFFKRFSSTPARSDLGAMEMSMPNPSYRPDGESVVEVEPPKRPPLPSQPAPGAAPTEKKTPAPSPSDSGFDDSRYHSDYVKGLSKNPGAKATA